VTAGSNSDSDLRALAEIRARHHQDRCIAAWKTGTPCWDSRCCPDNHCVCGAHWPCDAAALLDRLDKAEGALRRYGVHRSDRDLTSKFFGEMGGAECTCGYRAALTSADKEK
jgi:hypothetical protein